MVIVSPQLTLLAGLGAAQCDDTGQDQDHDHRKSDERRGDRRRANLGWHPFLPLRPRRKLRDFAAQPTPERAPRARAACQIGPEGRFCFRVKAEAVSCVPENRSVARFVSRYDARIVERLRLPASLPLFAQSRSEWSRSRYLRLT